MGSFIEILRREWVIREVVGKAKMEEKSLKNSLKLQPTDPLGQRATGVKCSAWEAKLLLQKILYVLKRNQSCSQSFGCLIDSLMID